MRQNDGLKSDHLTSDREEMDIVTLGVGLAKNIFQSYT